MDETRSCFIEEINQNELMSKKHSKVGTALSYTEHLLFWLLWLLEVSHFFAFASLVGIPIGITSSAVGLKISGITAGIKKKKKHDKTLLPIKK